MIYLNRGVKDTVKSGLFYIRDNILTRVGSLFRLAGLLVNGRERTMLTLPFKKEVLKFVDKAELVKCVTDWFYCKDSDFGRYDSAYMLSVKEPFLYNFSNGVRLLQENGVCLLLKDNEVKFMSVGYDRVDFSVINDYSGRCIGYRIKKDDEVSCVMTMYLTDSQRILGMEALGFSMGDALGVIDMETGVADENAVIRAVLPSIVFDGCSVDKDMLRKDLTSVSINKDLVAKAFKGVPFIVDGEYTFLDDLNVFLNDNGVCYVYDEASMSMMVFAGGFSHYGDLLEYANDDFVVLGAGTYIPRRRSVL